MNTLYNYFLDGLLHFEILSIIKMDIIGIKNFIIFDNLFESLPKKNDKKNAIQSR